MDTQGDGRDGDDVGNDDDNNSKKKIINIY